MPYVHVTNRDGTTVTVDGKSGSSVMEVLRDGGVSDVLALCGGCCSCATCHVYVDPEFQSRMPSARIDEKDLLDSLEHRRPASRLACQIHFEEALSGLMLTVAPEE